MSFAAFDIAAVFVCLICLVYMLLHRRWDKLQSKIFLAIILDVAVTAASNFVAAAIRAYAVGSAFAATGVQVAGYVYFATHTLLAPLFLMYVLAVSQAGLQHHNVRNALIGLPFYLAELMVLTNPLTGWVYSYGANLEMIRGWGMAVVYIVGIVYFVLGFAQLIRSWRALTLVKRRGLVFFFAVAGAGILIQLLNSHLTVELFAEALAVLGVILFVENEEDLIDSESGVYNRHALEIDLAMYAKTGRPFHIVAVRVTNADAFTHIGGSTYAAQFMGTTLADFFKTLMPWYRIYRANSSRFVLIDPQMSRDAAKKIAQTIADRFKASWEYHDVDVNLQAVVALACVPHDLPTPDDVFYLVDTPVSPMADKDVQEGDDLNYLMRRAEVERAVQRGLDEGNYEVYYQPIYDAEGKACAAEALMRLNDGVLGSVPPFEFIEVAERRGLIEEIGEFALREVCAFLSSGVPGKLGVEHISVNLSVIQCMHADFPTHVDEVVSTCGVDPHLVSFEITESVAAGDYGFLERVMSQLNETGHRFAMDDYGTGYSNMHSFIRLNFDVVKIDKSVLWDAEKSDMGMVILENSVNMLRNVGCSVLVEGVETAEQVEILRRLGVDYFQGFYFAKPMPKDEFVAHLQ